MIVIEFSSGIFGVCTGSDVVEFRKFARSFLSTSNLDRNSKTSEALLLDQQSSNFRSLGVHSWGFFSYSLANLTKSLLDCSIELSRPIPVITVNSKKDTTYISDDISHGSIPKFFVFIWAMPISPAGLLILYRGQIWVYNIIIVQRARNPCKRVIKGAHFWYFWWRHFYINCPGQRCLW